MPRLYGNEVGRENTYRHITDDDSMSAAEKEDAIREHHGQNLFGPNAAMRDVDMEEAMEQIAVGRRGEDDDDYRSVSNQCAACHYKNTSECYDCLAPSEPEEQDNNGGGRKMAGNQQNQNQQQAPKNVPAAEAPIVAAIAEAIKNGRDPAPYYEALKQIRGEATPATEAPRKSNAEILAERRADLELQKEIVALNESFATPAPVSDVDKMTEQEVEAELATETDSTCRAALKWRLSELRRLADENAVDRGEKTKAELSAMTDKELKKEYERAVCAGLAAVYLDKVGKMIEQRKSLKGESKPSRALDFWVGLGAGLRVLIVLGALALFFIGIGNPWIVTCAVIAVLAIGVEFAISQVKPDFLPKGRKLIMRAVVIMCAFGVLLVLRASIVDFFTGSGVDDVKAVATGQDTSDSVANPTTEDEMWKNLLSNARKNSSRHLSAFGLNTESDPFVFPMLLGGSARLVNDIKVSNIDTRNELCVDGVSDADCVFLLQTANLNSDESVDVYYITTTGETGKGKLRFK